MGNVNNKGAKSGEIATWIGKRFEVSCITFASLRIHLLR